MGKLFFFIDAVIFFLMTAGILYVRHGGLSSTFLRDQLYVFIPIFLFASFVLWLFSFYDAKLLRKQAIAYKRLVIAWLITLLGSASMIYFVSAVPSIHLPTPRRILIVILIVYFAYIYLFRRNYFKLDGAKTNVLIFGKSETISELIKGMRKSRGYQVKAYEEVPAADKKYKLKDIDMVITGSKLFRENPKAWEIITKEFIAKGIQVDTDFNAYEDVFQRISRESVQDSMWLLRGIGNRREHTMYNMLKRAMDLSLGLLMLPFLIPLACLIWLLVRVVDGYPPLFIQKRVGHLEKPIYIYKFRTIKPGGTEANITKCGKILRRFRLDEIPQVWNVIKGDISFVGPRPIWGNEYDFLNQYVPNHHIRTIVKPGITGWAQLNFKAPPTYFNFRDNDPQNLDPHAFDAAFTRLSYDVWYIKNHSISLDLEIMVKTGLRMFIKDSHVA